MTRRIPLTKGKFALVDDKDYEYLMSFGKWWLNNSGYAQKNIKNNYFLMHRTIMNTPKNMDTDHINRDKLDNRRSNLRICTAQENKRNIGIRKNNTSGVTGVHYKPTRDKWHARITVNYKRISLGYYSDIKDAIEARKFAEVKYFNQFIPIN